MSEILSRRNSGSQSSKKREIFDESEAFLDMSRTILKDSFYDEYHGHRPEHLDTLETCLRKPSESGPRNAIYLAGDSSLDNKFWFGDVASAVNGYDEVYTIDRQCTNFVIFKQLTLNTLLALSFALPIDSRSADLKARCRLLGKL